MSFYGEEGHAQALRENVVRGEKKREYGADIGKRTHRGGSMASTEPPQIE